MVLLMIQVSADNKVFILCLSEVSLFCLYRRIIKLCVIILGQQCSKDTNPLSFCFTILAKKSAINFIFVSLRLICFFWLLSRFVFCHQFSAVSYCVYVCVSNLSFIGFKILGQYISNTASVPFLCYSYMSDHLAELHMSLMLSSSSF